MLALEKMKNSVTKVVSSLMEFVSGGKQLSTRVLTYEGKRAMEPFHSKYIHDTEEN